MTILLKKPQWLQTKTGVQVPVMRTMINFPSINEKKQMELDIYIVSRLDHSRSVQHPNEPACQTINPAFTKFDRERENELHHFLQIYYGVAPIYKCEIEEKNM